jgi:serine/threonine-protein kinase
MSETLALSHGLPPSIREGAVLGGKYRLEREIGRGAMGTVWSAVHLTLGQRVAIKLIAAEYAQAPEARQRFSIEAKAAARLRSRHVVQIYDDGETPAGTPYIVLEYLEGETLEQRLERERDVPLNDAVRITRQVARALSRAHAQGIVHRDLKPGNVFLARSEDDEFGWIAKVLDFGIAKVAGQALASNTKTGTLLGTPLFMSPEQARGASTVDARSDLYSLGMVFYNMLTGELAFNGPSFADVLIAICTSPLPDLRASAPWVPQSVADWFQRACAREPQDRFQSADEMIEGLELALGVSTGAFSRQAPPEAKSETLRGHASPLTNGASQEANGASPLTNGAPQEAKAFGKGSTQILSTDPALLSSNPGTPARTLEPELALPTTTSRWPLFVGAGLVVLLIPLGAVLLLGHHKSPEPPQTAAPSALSVPAQTASEAAVVVAPIVPQGPAEPPSTVTAADPSAAAPLTTARPAEKSPGLRAPASPANSAKLPQKSGQVPASAPAPPAASSRNTPTDIGF